MQPINITGCLMFYMLIFFVNFEAEALTQNGGCTKDLLETNGSFKSLNRTKLKEIFVHENASNNVICTWRIFPQPGIIELKFTKLQMGTLNVSNECDSLVSLVIIDRSAPSMGQPLETNVCRSKPPYAYYSKGPSLDIVLRGQLLHPNYENYSFSALYSTFETMPTIANKCDPCGGIINKETGMIRSPRYPKQYPNNCDCKWNMYVRRGYILKLKFWAFSLEDQEDLVCHDFVAIYDGTSESSKQLGKFCGKRNPGSLRTSGTSALVYFHSDFSKGSTGFEVMYESSRDEEDLTSLRSIAAILGGVSFGIFIFLLLCSIIYKRYISSDDRRNTCPPSAGDNDYLDAVQAAAPPSYQTVMSDPEHYPRTPEVTPSASPAVTPSLLRRNLIRPTPLIHHEGHPLDSLEEVTDNGVETPPPPYPGNIVELFNTDDLLIEDLPPPPTYEMVSDNEEHDESLHTWAPISSQEDVYVDRSLDRRLVEIEEQSDSPSNTASTATQVTTCEDDLSCLNGRQDAPPARCRDGGNNCGGGGEGLCVQCIENSEIDCGTHRGRSDGDLRGSYSLVRTDPADSVPYCHHNVSFRQRKDFSCPSKRTQSSDNRHSHDGKRSSWLKGYQQRSLSVPSLAQRAEHSDTSTNRNIGSRHSPRALRSLFSRRSHSHNNNRVQPNNDRSDTQQLETVEPPAAMQDSNNGNTVLYIGDEMSRSSHI